MLSILIPLIAQVGIAPTVPSISAVPPELRNRPPREQSAPQTSPTSTALDTCLNTARTDPAEARALAEEWVSRTSGPQRAAGRHCLGVAAGNGGDWSTAAAAFLAARDDASEPRFRARMSALAGSAFLAKADPAQALVALDAGKGDAVADAEIAGAIALDRASALVALGREAEAAAALAEARTAVPQDAQAWLLSATLSRRSGDLLAAQSQIEQAATLDPRDPAIGLEAGVIAALGGRDDSARKSFQSVVAAAPDSAEGTAAKQYLTQLPQS